MLISMVTLYLFQSLQIFMLLLYLSSPLVIYLLITYHTVYFLYICNCYSVKCVLCPQIEINKANLVKKKKTIIVLRSYGHLIKVSTPTMKSLAGRDQDELQFNMTLIIFDNENIYICTGFILIRQTTED